MKTPVNLPALVARPLQAAIARPAALHWRGEADQDGTAISRIEARRAYGRRAGAHWRAGLLIDRKA